MFPPSAAVDFGAWFAKFAVLDKIPGSSVTPGQLLAPSVMYPQTPQPHAPLAPAPEAWTTPPADGDQAEAVIDDVIARTKAAQDVQMLNFFRNTFPADIGEDAPSLIPDFSFSLWKIAAIAAAALAVILILQARK